MRAFILLPLASPSPFFVFICLVHVCCGDLWDMESLGHLTLSEHEKHHHHHLKLGAETTKARDEETSHPPHSRHTSSKYDFVKVNKPLSLSLSPTQPSTHTHRVLQMVSCSREMMVTYYCASGPGFGRRVFGIEQIRF